MHASLPSDLYQHFTYFPLVCIVSSPGTTQNCSRQTSANIGQGRRDGVWIVHKKGCASAARQFTELLQGAVWSRTVHFLPVPRKPYYVFCLPLVPWNSADSLSISFGTRVYVCVFVSRGVGGCEQQNRYIHIHLHIPLHTYTNVHRQTTSYMHIGHLFRLIVQVLPFSICQLTLLLHFLALLLALLDLIFSIESQPPGNMPVRSWSPQCRTFWMLRRACLEKESRSSWFLRVGGSSAAVILAGFPILTVLGTRCGALNTQMPSLLLAILRLISSCNPEFICRVVVIQTRIIVATIVTIIFTCTVIGINVDESR